MNLFSNRFVPVFLVLLAVVGALVLRVGPKRESSGSASLIRPMDSRSRVSDELAAQVARLETRERKLAETVWAKEMLAQTCGRTFESLWDSLNASTNKLSLAADFPLGEIVLGDWRSPRSLPHGIEWRESAGFGSTLCSAEWRRLVQEFEGAGWQLAQTEFRHNRFDTDEQGQPRQSLFYFSAHLANPARLERAILEGDLIVDWVARQPGNEVPAVKRIDASRLTLKTRQGETPFQLILEERITPPENAYSIDPLILYDLDGDGLSEIILAGKNLVYRRRGENRYESEPLCRYPPGLIYTALIADFDGDAAADFLCQKHEGMVLLKGSPQGAFDSPERVVWPRPPDMKHPMVLIGGDIDQDGDLDVFVGQYKVPYRYGAMPTPFYDANDGYPAYLLLNDGNGTFTDATEASGLGKKRWRRSYSGSIADLDGDGHLDLVVVSDFAGVDLYCNNGHGQLCDVTQEWLAEPHAFGMSHTLADFNADGRLDLLLIGMNSPTVDRLEHLGLWRHDLKEDRTMRSRMTFGNRLCVARLSGGFEFTSLSDSIARSGWSWGCGALDFDNDGFPDVYIANGLESRESVREYEPEYWLHDTYVGNSEQDSAVYLYFEAKFNRTRRRGQSYGGYEKNRFYLNQQGVSFVEVGYLVGVALEQDSRNVVADDLDGDGRVDLVVTSYERWPSSKQTLRVFRNTLSDGGNWIGFRFCEEGQGNSPVGVRVALRGEGLRTSGRIVAGDSYRSQHANAVHFGLGEATGVATVEIHWPNGQSMALQAPAVNRYHSIRAPPTNLAPR